MSDVSGRKITVAILFVVIGLPPGLCSLYFTLPTLSLLGGHSAESRAYAVLFGVPCLVGLVIFGVMLWLLISTWRRNPT
jgi:hypothetical protein